MSSDRSLYLGDDPLRDDRDVPARCPDVARPDAPDAPSSGTRSGDRSWKHATVFPPMHRTGEVGPVLSVRAPIVLEPTRRRTCRAVELWSSPSRGVKTLDRVFCYTKSGSAAVSTWNAHADLQKSQIPRKLDTKTAQQTVTPPDDSKRTRQKPNQMMSSLCQHRRKRKKTWTAEAHRRRGHYVAHCSSAAHHTRALPRSTSHLRHKHGEASRHVLRRLRSASRPLSPERVGRRES